MTYRLEQRLKIHGLANSPNQFSEIPEGSLLIADNVNLDRDSVLSTRRGMAQYGNPVDATGNIYSLFTYTNKLITWTTENTLYADTNGDGTLWTPYAGTFEVPDNSVIGSRIRSFQSNKNFYFTTSQGVFKLDSYTATPILAGAPAALGGSAALTGSSGFMADDTAVAYRIVWGYKDANDNLILGAASDRIIVVNSSGGSRDVNITFTVPFSSYITTSWFYQVYRSDASATAADIPNDNYDQVIEGNPTSGELTARSITVTDITPDSLRQATLYSSADAEGAVNANYPPPYCKDMCSFRNFAFYANTREAHFLNLTLLAVGSPQGIQINDTITITSGVDTFTITGKASENAAAGQFLVDTSGTPSQNNEVVAHSIVNVINQYASNTFLNAFYASGFDDLAGQILFQKRTIDSTNFRINSSRITCWSPVIPSSGTNSSNVSFNNVFPNRIYVSKLQQPEAVPLVQYFDIASASEPIQRVIPLRDAVMIFKTDGIYSISGDDTSNFRVSTLDNTAIALAVNSIISFNNACYFFGQQGICRITPDGSTEVISVPIERELLALSSSNFANFPELTNAVAYESERKYILSTVSTPTDTVCTQQYVYNSLTNSWTKWDRPNYCGIVSPGDNKLYFGGEELVDGPNVYQERKTYTSQDYADEQYPVTIVSSTGLSVVLADVTNVSVDMSIVQDAASSIVTGVNTMTNTITVADLTDWVPGAAEVFTPIDTLVRTTQISGGNPGVIKQIAEVSLIFETPNFNEIDVTFYSDYVSGGESVVLHPTPGGAWGEFPWGTVPWGGDVISNQRLRTLVPKNVQRNNWMIMDVHTNQCFINFALEGFVFGMNFVGPRQKN